MTLPLSFQLVGIGAFLLGLLWGALKPENRYLPIVRRVFFGWTLGFIGVLTFGSLKLEATNLAWAQILLFFVGVAGTAAGYWKHGSKTWIDATTFILISATLGISSGAPQVHGYYNLISSMPAGASSFIFIRWLWINDV